MSANVCPPDHAHGQSRNCYKNHRCRCLMCRDANRRYINEYRQKSRGGQLPDVPVQVVLPARTWGRLASIAHQDGTKVADLLAALANAHARGNKETAA